MDLKLFTNLLEKSQTLVLATHENPDIDGIASMLSFLLLHPDKTCLPILEKLPHNASFLHGIEYVKLLHEIDDLAEVYRNTPLLVVFDAQCEKRIPREIKNLLNPKEVLIFDHHVKEDCQYFLGITPHALIDPEEPSTTALLYKFFKKANYQITKEVAENLLAGLYYDTGAFKYDNVKSDAFLIAYDLVNLGARPTYITKNLYENIPFEQIEATKLILSRLEFLKEGAIAISYLTASEVERLGERGQNDFASFLRSIEGVVLSAIVKEVKKGEIKVSLRSMAPLSALPIAKKYGGGGHKYACGFTIKNKELFPFLNDFKKVLKSSL
ncbi:MAG: DHH family phosphoesterase [Caldimicrobium sp.]